MARRGERENCPEIRPAVAGGTVTPSLESTSFPAFPCSPGPSGPLLPSASTVSAFQESRARQRSMYSAETRETDGLQLLRAADLCKLLRISKPTLWRLRRRKGFPQPTGVTDRVVAWRRCDVGRLAEDAIEGEGTRGERREFETAAHVHTARHDDRMRHEHVRTSDNKASRNPPLNCTPNCTPRKFAVGAAAASA